MKTQRMAQTYKLYVFMVFSLLLCIHESYCDTIKDKNTLLPEISPNTSPQPFLPLLAPSPLTQFTNSTIPNLSGLCTFNFSSLQTLISITAMDCVAAFAPFVANIICCPQLEATMIILIGQSSKLTNTLALNTTHSKHCLEDLQQILISQGANNNLSQICSTHPSSLSEGFCPVYDINEFESVLDSSNLLTSCEKIDLVNECCKQTCENSISEAATKLASQVTDTLSDQFTRINDCKIIVHRWLASKLDPYRAKEVLRGLSNCKTNKKCPLSFPKMENVVKRCNNEAENLTACCNSVENYVSHLQKQSFTTNLQALNCAASLGLKLQKANITKNVYNLCHISLKDFSLQVTPQVSGCLLPSLPSDLILDTSNEFSFQCDLNDNIPAPWPSMTQLPGSSCNKTLKIPALPAAASGQNGLYSLYNQFFMILMVFVTFMIFIN